MSKIKQLKNLASQAEAEQDKSIYYGFLQKCSDKNRRLKKYQKQQRKKNRI